jgi:hypothetical protein
MQNEVKVTNMDDFEKQLNESSNVIDLDDKPIVNRLKENEINIIDGSREFNKPEIVAQAKPEEKKVKVNKNVILALQSDASGCGFIRCFQPFSYLQFVFGKDQKLLPIISSIFIQDENTLLRTRTIYFQRQMSPEHLKQVKWYKERQSTFKYRMTWEFDDHIWWEDDARTIHGVPSYNFGSKGITEDVKHASIEIMNLMDQLIVSTQPLADYIKNKLGVKVPIKVIKNHVAKYFWKDGNPRKITEKIVKPKFIITSSPTHYDNANKNAGDFKDSAWVEYLVKNVKEDKISLSCLGGLPFFFEHIKDKIKVIPWLNSFQYHNQVLGERADFGIMPLVPNLFNVGKSNLKFLEFSAAKIVAFGTYFKDGYQGYQGPYHDMPLKLDYKCTVKQIEDNVEFYSQPENYNKIVDMQLKYLEDNGHWLESPKWINEFLSVL